MASMRPFYGMSSGSFRRGVVRLTIGTPLVPTGITWDAAVALRDQARGQILRVCGEPDLAPTTVPGG